MNSRVTVKDIAAMLLIIISFTATGVMIKNEDYKYALVSLSFAAVCVLIAFVIIIIEDNDKILDLSNPSLRNPRKSSNSAGKVKYIDRLTPDMIGGKVKSSKNKSKNEDLYLVDANDDFYESVGNMRVYQRGEDIELFEDDETEEFR